MILSGGSRGGALDLALHLSNELDNERVEIASVRGATSTNLYDAFREFEAVASCSNAKHGFYSLSISPDPEQRDWTNEEWQHAIEHTEQKLSLMGQPRAIVFHEKVGESDGNLRKHCHVVWSRISTQYGKLRAISDSNDRYKLRDATRELALEFGLRIKRGRKSKEAYELAKSQGRNRDPETTAERKATLTELWERYEDPKQFVIAANKAGYVIAKGDRRDFVIIDRDEEIFALPRQIDGVKTKQIRERLGSDSDDLPTVKQAKEEQRIRRQREARELRKPPLRRVDLTREQKLMAKLRRMAKRADTLRLQRRQKLKDQIIEATQRHNREWEWMRRRFRQQTTKIITKRRRREPKGLAKHLRTLIGYETLLKWKHAQQDRDRVKAFAKQQLDMKKAQTKELERIEDKHDLIEKQERREAKSLERLSKKLAISVQRAKQEQERAQQLKQLKQRENEKIRFSRG